MPNGFSFDVGTVIDGADFTVKVFTAPCENVHVRFLVDGVEVASSPPVGVPGETTFHAPGGSQGKVWVIDVFCADGDVESKTGRVA